MNNLTTAMGSLSLGNKPSNVRLNKVNSSTKLSIKKSYGNALKLASDFKKKTGQVIKYPVRYKNQAAIVYHLIVIYLTIMSIYGFYSAQTDLYIYSDEGHVSIILGMMKLIVAFNKFSANIARVFPAAYSTVYTALITTGGKVAPKLWKDPTRITKPLNLLNSANFQNIQQKVAGAFMVNMGRSFIPGSTAMLPTLGNQTTLMLNSILKRMNTAANLTAKTRVYREMYRQFPDVMYPFRREFDNFLSQSTALWLTTITTLSSISTIKLLKPRRNTPVIKKN